MTNMDCIEAAQTTLAKMANLIKAHDNPILVEDVVIEVGQQVKTELKQAINALKVDVITTINQVKVT